MREIAAAILVGSIMLSVQPALAQKRVALVIGNGAYQKVPTLPNPTNDATDIGKALERLDFRVTQLGNATASEMRRTIVEFGRSVEDADMAVVFYAGHGMEVGGENWLIPTDAELRSDTDVENEAVSLRSISGQVSKAHRLGLVILDACRNNPFAVKMKRAFTLRATTGGLAPTEPTDNVLIAYAARDGTLANDGNGRNSPFSAALLRHIETPGLEISFLFRRVRDDVMTTTKREQQPFVYGSLSKEEIYFKSPRASDPAERQPVAAQPKVRTDTPSNLLSADKQDFLRPGATIALARAHDLRISTEIKYSTLRVRPKPRKTRSSIKFDLTIHPDGRIDSSFNESGRFGKTGNAGAFKAIDENTIQRVRELEDHIQSVTVVFSTNKCRVTMANKLRAGFNEWEGRSTELGTEAFYKDWVMTSSSCTIARSPG
jgi:uncharacterized caspase-like protein